MTFKSYVVTRCSYDCFVTLLIVEKTVVYLLLNKNIDTFSKMKAVIICLQCYQ